jgi:integrase
VEDRTKMTQAVGGIERVGRSTNKLSDRAIKAFVASARNGSASTKKLSDGGGLYITLTPAGSAVWRLKYRLVGKERLYAIGVYPAVGLEAARAQRAMVKELLREGRDPLKTRQLTRASAAASSDTTFAGATEEWLSRRKADWSDIHYLKSRQALERDVLPALGTLPVSDITPAMVAKVVESVVSRGAGETASKILWNVICIFRLAQARGLREDNPATPVRELLPKRKAHTQRPALLDFKALGDLLRRAELAPLSPAVRIAHRLVSFTAARIGNIVEAQWKEFDLDSETPSWTIPRAKMKMRERAHDHRVLLGPTIVGELRTWRAVTGGKGYVFPSPSGNVHITRESLEKAYRKTLGMEGKHSVHGWRASFSTLARDAGFSRDVVELTLDHIHDNAVARAYDRGERLVERQKLMYWWDSQLSSAQHGATVIPLRAAEVA